MTNLDIPALIVATVVGLLCVLWLRRKPNKPKIVRKAITLDDLVGRIAAGGDEGGPDREEIRRILSEALDAQQKK